MTYNKQLMTFKSEPGAGIEPATSILPRLRSILLSYPGNTLSILAQVDLRDNLIKKDFVAARLEGFKDKFCSPSRLSRLMVF